MFIHSNAFLQKMCLSSCVEFTLIYGPFSCLIYVLFGPILMENYVCFSNSSSILELMLCNLNLTKLDILTLQSSNCRAWALKLSEHLKKKKNMFLSSFYQIQLKHNFCPFFTIHVFFLIIHIHNLHLILVMITIFHKLMTVMKVGKN